MKIFNIQRKKSFYYKFRASLLLVLLVPMLTISFVFVQAQNLIREQILLASKNTLNQFFLRIDDIAEESRNICLALLNSSECRNYATFTAMQSEKGAYQEVRVRNVMQGYLSERYYDIFMYYPSSNRIISARNASNDIDEYFDIYYKDNSNDFYDKFRNIATNASEKAELNSMRGKTNKDYLCVSMKNNVASKGIYDFAVVVVLNPIYVSEVLKEMEDDEQKGISMIFSDLGDLIITTSDIAVEYCLPEPTKENVSFEDNINGVKYVIQRTRSDILEVYYAYAVSGKYFWNKLYRLYIICSIGAIIALITGILLIRKQSRKIYQPISNMVSRLQMESVMFYDEVTDSEFDFFEALLLREKEEKQGLRRLIQKGEIAKKEQFIFSLLMGNVNVSEESNDNFKENGIALCSEYFFVMMLEIENDGNLEQEILQLVIFNVYNEIYRDEDMIYILPLDIRRYAILINKFKSDDARIYELTKKGFEILNKQYNVSATCGISTCQEGMMGIHEGYKEACQALKYEYFLGIGSIIRYQQIADREFHYANASTFQMSHLVSNYLAGYSNCQNSNEVVLNIMEIYEIDESISIETMECFKFEVVSMLKRVMIQSGCQDNEWRNNALELLDRRTLEAFEEKFTEIIDYLFIRMQENEKQKDICTRTKKYIEDHYSEEQLSLTLLGEIVDIAPSYLSKLFKAKYQISIPDYIAKVRVDHAKLQLSDTNLNLQEVAKNSGFLNANSFIRTFKKQEGITPGVYREFFEKKI